GIGCSSVLGGRSGLRRPAAVSGIRSGRRRFPSGRRRFTAGGLSGAERTTRRLKRRVRRPKGRRLGGGAPQKPRFLRGGGLEKPPSKKSGPPRGTDRMRPGGRVATAGDRG